jgi:hypothetical protein
LETGGMSEDQETIRERFYDMARRQFNAPDKPAEPKRAKPQDDDDQAGRPTPERLAKAVGDDGESLVETISVGENVNWRALRLNDSPLGRLHFRKKPAITGDQYVAGWRYYADAYYGGFLSSGVVNPEKERVDGGTYKDVPDTVLAAQTRFRHAARVLDRDDSHILSDVVLSEMEIGIYADRFRQYALPRERRLVAIAFLCRALDKLDAHYSPPRRAMGIRASVGERPVIAPDHVDDAA